MRPSTREKAKQRHAAGAKAASGGSPGADDDDRDEVRDRLEVKRAALETEESRFSEEVERVQAERRRFGDGEDQSHEREFKNLNAHRALVPRVLLPRGSCRQERLAAARRYAPRRGSPTTLKPDQ